jgi:Mg-chelatase subunit ChlD
MAGAHPDFQRVSPALGQLDTDAFDELRRRDPDAASRLLSDLVSATDRELRRRARRLAARVFVGLARTGPRPRRGYRRMASNVGAGTGDVDLEQTLERAGGRPRRAEDMVVRDWRSAERAACLLLDHSGSMRGRALALAAVAAASVVLAAEGRASCSVVAFNNDAVVLKAQGRRRAPERLVSDILALRPGGTTDLELALRAAAGQLARADSPERVAIVMSDCLATTGGDPLAALSGIDRLHVLGTSADPESVRQGRRLARRAGGRYVAAATFAQVTRGLSGLLA